MSIKKNPLISLKILLTIIIVSLGIEGCQESPSDRKKEDIDAPSMVRIPKGEFIFGNDSPDLTKIPLQLQKVKKWGQDQKPQQKTHLPAFYIDRYEVTNVQYKEFKKSYAFTLGKNDHPAANINWHDADKYCRALNKRLPTEMEWEKAARGPDGNLFPWGNKFDKNKANTGFSRLSSTTPVGTFPGDVSFYNVYDMAGNVSEWTSNWYLAYEGSEFKSSNFGKTYKVARGGSFQDMGHYELEIFSTTTFRYFNRPEEWAGDTGFRCAKDVKN